MDELADGRLAPPRGKGGIELADVVLRPARLDTSEDVDAAVAELEAVVEVAGLQVGGPDDGEPRRQSG